MGVRHPDRQMKATRAEPHDRGRAGHQPAPRLVGCYHPVKQFAVGFCVGPHARPVEAAELQGTGARHPSRNNGAVFRRRPKGEVGGAYGGYVDMKIEAVEQGTRDPR